MSSARRCRSGTPTRCSRLPDLSGILREAWQYYNKSDLGKAATLCRDILKNTPHDAGALCLLSIIAQQKGNLQLALQLIDDALAAHPSFASGHFNRSVILRLLGRDADALLAARRAVDVDPSLAEGWDMVAQLLKNTNAYDEAAACHRRALQLKPDNPQFYCTYALLMQAAGNLTDACRAAQVAESIAPDYPPMILGNLLKAMGHPEKAADRFARVRALRPDLTEALASEAMARLQMGDFVRGWALWEQRPDLTPDLAFPFWQGQKIDRLLLYEDQGIGDAIHFMRYIPWAKQQVGSVVLRLRGPLRRLVADMFPDMEILGSDSPLPAIDARCRLSSLGALCKEPVPLPPYVAARDDQKSVWRERMRSLPRPRLGLVWAGNPAFHSDYARSLDLSALRPLLACGATHFVSLQKDRPGDAAFLAAAGIYDASPDLHDFADTAALIAELDLVIAVDTAVAHLAGAMGKPVFILLPFDSDWRWLIGREDSIWYPTARLFRQKRPGDWTPVIDVVAAQLDKFLNGDKQVLTPAPWRGDILRQNPDALSLPI